jgi:hypothetical protein
MPEDYQQLDSQPRHRFWEHHTKQWQSLQLKLGLRIQLIHDIIYFR